MKAYIVTGLAFGDEGKGATVDYLARQGSTVVVRHNGGPQAAHNVVTPDGRHHTFSQYGSGTFTGASTFLSKYMLINPLNMMREAAHLYTLGQNDLPNRTYVDLDAKVITPYHVLFNRAMETARGDDRHGSCGEGVGVAMSQDIRRPDLTIRVRDLSGNNLAEQLSALRVWTCDQAEDLNVDDQPSPAPQDLVPAYSAWLTTVRPVESDHLATLVQQVDQVVFEGAQGVLLDEWYGFHPYTTWSTCTHENAYRLLTYLPPMRVTRLGVIRAYMTRHGPGPFPTESEAPQGFSEPHNAYGEWQGAWRTGHLDLVLLRYALAVCGGVDELVVNHLDARAEFGYCWDYQEVQDLVVGDRENLPYQEYLTDILGRVTPIYSFAERPELLKIIEDRLGAPVWLTSYGPTADEKCIVERVP